MAAALTAVIVYAALTETGGVNSAALIADGFLQGRLWVEQCFDLDCAYVHGRTYVVFPPFPGLAALPLVALGGVQTSGFIFLVLIAFSLSLVTWSRIFGKLGVERSNRLWLLLAIGFASPLFFVTIRGDGIWFNAQALGFLLVTLALHEALSGRLLTSGLAIGCAFLSRQMSIFYLPLLFVLSLGPASPITGLSAASLARGLRLALPACAAILIYLAYNYGRFGAFLETGYGYVDYPSGVLRDRLDTSGLWSADYLIFNLYHAVVQGFHAEFAGPGHLELVGMDRFGTAIPVASPWLAMLFFTPVNRRTLWCGVLVAVLFTVMLFYHSNGYTQYNVQRYSLDWLPAALIMMAYAAQRHSSPLFPLAVLWGMGLNLVTVATMAMAMSQ
jgi:hypothetical protein